MPSYGFNSGYVAVRDSAGNAHQFSVVTDVSVDTDATTKSLKGPKLFDLVEILTAKKISGKIKAAKVDGATWAALNGGSVTSGRVEYVFDLAKAFGASIVVSPTGTGMSLDLGVKDANGARMTLTSSAPAVGSYAVATGTATYTFNASQAGTGSISYAYSKSTGYTATVSDADQAVVQTFELHLRQTFTDGTTFCLRFPTVSIPKLSQASKAEDFFTYDLDFKALPDGSGKVAYAYYE